MDAEDKGVSKDMLALAAELKRLDHRTQRDDLARVEDLMGRHVRRALVMAIDQLETRAQEIAAATVREGVTGTRRVLAEIGADLGSIALPIKSIKIGDARARRRVITILSNPLAERLPRMALALCAAEGVTAEQAIEALRISATTGGAPFAVGVGAERLH